MLNCYYINVINITVIIINIIIIIIIIIIIFNIIASFKILISFNIASCKMKFSTAQIIATNHYLAHNQTHQDDVVLRLSSQRDSSVVIPMSQINQTHH